MSTTSTLKQKLISVLVSGATKTQIKNIQEKKSQRM